MTALSDLVDRPQLRTAMVRTSVFGHGARFTVSDPRGGPLAVAEQRISSAWQWLGTFIDRRGTRSRSIVDLTVEPAGPLLAIERPSQGAGELDLVARQPDGQLLGTLDGRRLGRKGITLWDSAGAPVATLHHSPGLAFAVDDAQGSTLATLRTDPPGTSGYLIDFRPGTGTPVRVLTLVAAIGLDLQRQG